MPHVIAEFSDNLNEHVTTAELMTLVHESVLATGLFSTGGTRLRAAPRTDYILGDGSPGNMFCHIQLLIAPGRDPELLLAAKEMIFGAVEAGLKEVFATGALA